MSKLGDYLKKLRADKVEKVELSLRSAAKGAEINYQTLSNYEEGKVERFDASVLKSLADYYGVSLEDMMKHV